MKIYEELVARGLIAQVTNEEEIKKMVNEGKATFYIGFDPTADSLHVGLSLIHIYITGAYVAGIVLCSLRDSDYIASKMDVNSYMIFGPVFFASIGLKTSVANLTPELLAFSAAFVLVALSTKIVGCGLMAKLCGCLLYTSVFEDAITFKIALMVVKYMKYMENLDY